MLFFNFCLLVVVKIFTKFIILACEGFICASGAQCIVTSIGPTCKCLDGLLGNPFPGGQCNTDICSKNNPCEEPNICINGRCRQRCQGVECGVGAHCSNTTNKCICDHMFDGNPYLLCMPSKFYASIKNPFLINQ